MRPERLTPHARDLTTRSLDWMDQQWDPEAGLLRAPEEPGGRGGAPVGHMVRETGWYALGLLMRNLPARSGSGPADDGVEADLDRARRALGRVLDHQLDAPGERFHGTWLRGPHEQRPTARSVEWRDYDPNWREFIGTTLVVVATEFPEALDGDLSRRVDAALRLAVEGTLARGVDPRYTNIALMTAFLLQHAAVRLGEPAWDAPALRLAEQVLARFRVDGTFDEYNSPTYYGIDLYALALWRRYAHQPLLRAAGAEMEAGLWQDTARHYHAGLRNLAGPYDRSYGMDLRQYASGIGLWIWASVGRGLAPFPETDRPFRHAWDLALGPVVAVLGAEVPVDALAHLTGFRGERQVDQVIVRDPRRVATSWVGERLLVGAEDVGGERGNLADQFHPATVHWAIGAGPDNGGAVRDDAGRAADVGWIRPVSDLAVDARADGPSLALTCDRHDGGDLALAFQVRAPGLDPAGFAADRWALPGLEAVVQAEAELVAVEPDPRDDTWWVRYVARAVPAGRPTGFAIALRITD
ncbi:hypothetical protein [Promicromonospora kroppenstedtii]|uniref:hypothetical protein n=1 Tax=Promicromonospora kroppenstedtii TaxID=440482 RepID=UPI0004BCC6E5|nr:hypothetical protein [Promicromonospora kroppenstedtii]